MRMSDWRSDVCSADLAFSEGTAEVEARQAGIRSESRERDVRIAVRTQALDRAKQRLRRQPAHDRPGRGWRAGVCSQEARGQEVCQLLPERSEEHTSELQSLMRISYAVFCLKKKKKR